MPWAIWSRTGADGVVSSGDISMTAAARPWASSSAPTALPGRRRTTSQPTTDAVMESATTSRKNQPSPSSSHQVNPTAPAAAVPSRASGARIRPARDGPRTPERATWAAVMTLAVWRARNRRGAESGTVPDQVGTPRRCGRVAGTGTVRASARRSSTGHREGSPMTTSKFDRFLPIAGVLVGLLFVAVNALTWGSPDSTDAQELTEWGASHETRVTLAGVGLAYIAVLMAFFAVALRGAIRAGEAEESTYSSVAFAGGLMIASASALWAYVSLTTMSAISEGDAAAVSTMAHFTSMSWLPWLIGSAVLFLAVGIGALRTAALPRWLAVVTIVLGVLCLTGVGGIAVYLASPVWFVVTGFVLHRRLSTGGAA